MYDLTEAFGSEAPAAKAPEGEMPLIASYLSPSDSVMINTYLNRPDKKAAGQQVREQDVVGYSSSANKHSLAATTSG